MLMIKKIAFFAAVLMLPTVALAADLEPEQTHWSVEVKGGLFYPDFEDWSTFYGSNRTWQAAGAVGYKLFRQLEVGVEGGMMRDNGRAVAPTTGVMTGTVEYSLWPLNVYVLGRAVFSENQWIVPYAGGGWTRMFYREKIEGQGTSKGSADGYHVRAGIQLLLDNLDPSASNNLFMDFGIRHTYLIFEVEYTRVMAETQATASASGREVNIGGTSYLGGFLFEF